MADNITSLNTGLASFTAQSLEQKKTNDQNDLAAVAEQFEAIFIEALMRQSRQSKLSEGLFENKTDDNFQQMLDQELANKSSSSVDIGIATSIVRQMSKNGT